MPKFRKKPVEIEAYLFDQQQTNYRPDWFSDAVTANKIITFTDHALINTLEGQMRANLGDWIIQGVKGEIYPCKPDIFVATYDEVITNKVRPTIAELEKILNGPDDRNVRINSDGSVTMTAQAEDTSVNPS